MLSLSNVGHYSRLIKNNKGEISEAGKADGIPFRILETAHYEKQEIQLSADDLVIAYCHGAIEPVNRAKQQFGVGRFRSIIAETENSPKLLISNLQRAITKFNHIQLPFDDLTLLVFKI
jgi:serine phosphatase RsbU (regulator of sigma subunit)|tara:strand:- start:22 stop:378 length:357 start_codon:yes stop_codon:yes gene_type:complete